MDAARIAVVDDDPQIRSALRQALEASGFDVVEAGDAPSLRAILQNHKIDLITLDIGLPGTSGIDLARELSVLENLPVIFVSARSEAVDRVVGLEVGADDYIVKPFNIRELVARVRAVLRRARSAEPKIQVAASAEVTSRTYQFNGYTLSTLTRTLTDQSNKLIPLTSTEYSLLAFLLQNAGKTCTRDQISCELKGYEWSPNDRSLDTLVARLRRKIEPEDSEPSIVRSVRGVGYVMTGSMTVEPISGKQASQK